VAGQGNLVLLHLWAVRSVVLTLCCFRRLRWEIILHLPLCAGAHECTVKLCEINVAALGGALFVARELIL